MTASTVSRPRTVAMTWVRKNLFRGPRDTLITLVFGPLALFLAYRVVRFVFVTGRWEVIQVNLKLLLLGRWPVESMTRLAAVIACLGAWGGAIAGMIAGRQIRMGTSRIAGMALGQRVGDLARRFGMIFATVVLLLALTDTAGPWITAVATVAAGVGGYWLGRWIGARGLRPWLARLLLVVLIAVPIALFFSLTAAVPLASWEGFMFNITAAVAGIVLCFPLGVLLALGRRSKLPLVRSVSVAYVEALRGSPLFVLLLLANVSLEFFVPVDLAPSKVIRAVVTFTLFTAAYLAEIVRGGLQSVPNGQEEAAKALGLSPTRQVALVILPQALRNVIPAQIGQFISLFKDTVLAGVALGVLDLLAAAGAITKQPAFNGQRLLPESLVFIGFLFWVGSFTMSRESQRLERRLGVGTR